MLISERQTPAKRRLLPHPLVSMVMVVLWVLLVGSTAIGHLVLALVLAWLLPWITQTFWLYPVRVRRWRPLIRYISVVLWDITLSNVTAARLVLGPRSKLQPALFKLPLDITDPFAIAVLANTITLTPGTVSADIAQDRSYILIHGLHAPDTEAAVIAIKQRYETPLKEIF